MPVINKRDRQSAKRYLQAVTAALKAVASGDDDEALQTLQDMVEDSDNSFEDTLDATETLASLITLAGEDDEDMDDEEDEYEDEDEDLEEVSRLRTKASVRGRADHRAQFLDTALASLDDDEEDEEDEEDEYEDEDDVDLDDDSETADADEEFEDEEDEEELIEESSISKRIQKRKAERASATAKVATPKAKSNVADGRGRL